MHFYIIYDNIIPCMTRHEPAQYTSSTMSSWSNQITKKKKKTKFVWTVKYMYSLPSVKQIMEIVNIGLKSNATWHCSISNRIKSKSRIKHYLKFLTKKMNSYFYDSTITSLSNSISFGLIQWLYWVLMKRKE